MKISFVNCPRGHSIPKKTYESRPYGYCPYCEPYVRLAISVIDELRDRSGFDSWWDQLDLDIQSEIIKDVAHRIRTHRDRSFEWEKKDK